MKTLSATEAKNSFAQLLDDVRTDAVVIQRHNRTAAVVVSPEEFEDYRKLKTERLMEICRQNSAYAKSKGMNEKVLAKLLAEDHGR